MDNEIFKKRLLESSRFCNYKHHWVSQNEISPLDENCTQCELEIIVKKKYEKLLTIEEDTQIILPDNYKTLLPSWHPLPVEVKQKGRIEGLSFCYHQKHWLPPSEFPQLNFVYCTLCEQDISSRELKGEIIPPLVVEGMFYSRKKKIWIDITIPPTCSNCNKEHVDLKKNGEIAIQCFKCRDKAKESRKKWQKVDKNGLICCSHCGKHQMIENFPELIYSSIKSEWCIKCVNYNSEYNKRRYIPFKVQVEEYRKIYPNSAISGHPIEDDDDHFDHIPEKGIKIGNVTDFGFWASGKAGETLQKRLKLHLLELKKTQRITVAEHRQLTVERVGKLSLHPGTILLRERIQMVREENWDFIHHVQNGRCGCGTCEEALTRDMAVDFDHMWGEKSFNMGHAFLHSKVKRTKERTKGRFIIHSHHRKLTRKRLQEARDTRNVKKIHN